MFFYIFIFLIFLFFFLNIFFSNVVFWWSIFVLITLLFLFINKVSLSFSRSLNYFVFQEFLGLIFLISLGLTFQFFILLIKVGVSPFHFWGFSILSYLDRFLLIWFLTFQKLPFIPVIIYLFRSLYFIVFFFGLVYCYFQIYILKNFKFMFFVSSTESFNWLLFGLIFGFWGVILLFFYYIFNIFFLIVYINFFGLGFLPLETVFVFVNIPFSITFFFKILLLNLSVFLYDFFLLIILLLIFFSTLSFIGWISFFRLKSLSFTKDFYHYLSFLIWVFFYIFIFYLFSKINYIALIEWSSFERIKLKIDFLYLITVQKD